MTKKRSAFLAATQAVQSADPVSPESSNLMGSRLDSIGRAQQSIRTNTLEVSTEECKIWDRHNRNFQLLSEDRCADLIESFISQGRQETPAIVRRLNTRQNPKYEIITGARRFWTVLWLNGNNYPDFKYLVEVRDLTDEQAFRLSNLENLDRKDITDYERALDFQAALKFYYNERQADMAARLNKTEVWLSRYITMAELPKQIADAYADWGDLKLTHAPEIKKLLNNKSTMKKVMEAATDLRAQHLADKAAGRSAMPGAKVFKHLKDAAAIKPQKKQGFVKTFSAGDHDDVITLTTKNKQALFFVVKTSSDATQEEISAGLAQALKEYLP